MAKNDQTDNVIRESATMIPVLIRLHWNSPEKESMHLVGEPSTAKSFMVRKEAMAIAKDEGREFLEWNRVSDGEKRLSLKSPERYFVFADVRASETDVGELRLQEMTNGEPFMTFKYALLFEVLSKPNIKAVLMLDELNNAPTLQKTQFFKVINDRAIGDLPISDGVLVISAGNEVEHSYGSTEDPVPLVLRRSNYFIRAPTAEEFTDFGFQAGIHEWVLGYVAFAPQDCHNVKYDNPNSVGQPCTRTWTKMSNILRANPKMPMSEVRAVARGYVGQAVGEKFGAYVEMAKKVRIEEVIANPQMVLSFDQHRDLSLVYAVVTGVVDKYRTEAGAKKDKVVDAALQISLLLREELGVYMVRQMKNVDEPTFRKKVVTHEKFRDDFTKKYGKYFFSEVQ